MSELEIIGIVVAAVFGTVIGAVLGIRKAFNNLEKDLKKRG